VGPFGMSGCLPVTVWQTRDYYAVSPSRPGYLGAGFHTFHKILMQNSGRSTLQ